MDKRPTSKEMAKLFYEAYQVNPDRKQMTIWEFLDKKITDADERREAYDV